MSFRQKLRSSLKHQWGFFGLYGTVMTAVWIVQEVSEHGRDAGTWAAIGLGVVCLVLGVAGLVFAIRDSTEQNRFPNDRT